MFTSGVKNVTTAGTAEPLGAGDGFYEVITIQAKTANTTAVYVGGSDVDANEGMTLDPTQATANDQVTLRNVTLSGIYVDAATNSEGVTWTGQTAGAHPASTTVPLNAG